MPTPIQNAGAWTRLQELFGILGRHKLQLDEVVVPVVVIGNTTEIEEFTPLDATYVFHVPADVAGPSSAILLNDAGSGVRMLIDRVVLTTSTTHAVEMRLSTTAPLNAVAGGFANQSWNNFNQPGGPPGTLFGDHGSFVGLRRYANFQIANTPYAVFPKLVVEPGVELVVSNTSGNLILRCTVNVRIESLG